MSLVNLLGTLFIPHYLAMYLSESNTMIEARARGQGCHFNGVVSKLIDNDPDPGY
jgi:hypothetical protein